MGSWSGDRMSSKKERRRIWRQKSRKKMGRRKKRGREGIVYSKIVAA